MNITLKESKLILNWFDIASEIDSLGDADLRLYDKISEFVEDELALEDPLSYNPKKKTKKDSLFEEFEDLSEEYTKNSY